MSRPLRVQYEGACYHVINRGNRREVVFTENSDCELFLEKLIYFSELYEVIIHSYCLMPNHFHLQIRTRHANLSKFMQSFLTSFTISMNNKHQKSGHLFQGRYKAQLVESELYKNKLSRYIHLNPVKTKSMEALPSATLKSRLVEYKWSSYRYYAGVEQKPKWLNRHFILSSWGSTAKDKIHNYREYVEDGINTDNTNDISASLNNSILGTEKFWNRILEKHLNHDVADIDSREQPLLAEINAFTLDDVLDAVSAFFNVTDFEKITIRRGAHSEARKTALFLAGKHCRRKATLTSLAKKFGIKISGFNMASDKFKNRLKNHSAVQNKINNIENIMKNK